MVAVSPTEHDPTHHISLTDGATTLGLILCDRKGNPDNSALRESGMPRTATRVSQGPGGYGDFEYPYTPIAQSDFIGGRGMEDFESDVSRYYDSFNVDTTRGDIVLTGKKTATTGLTGDQNSAPTTTYLSQGSAIPHVPAVRTYASSFVAAFADVSAITVAVRNPPSAAPDAVQSVTIKIRANSAGNPSTTVFTTTLDAPPGAVTVPCNVTLVVGTTYWITVKAYVVGASAKAGSNVSRSSDDGTSWYQLDAGLELTFRLHNAGKADCRYFLAEYRGQVVAIANYLTGGISKFFVNGLRGFATSNSADLWRLNTTLSLSAYNLRGCVVQIVAGKGVEEETNWRRISDNTKTGTNDYLQVTPPWTIAHDTTTEYVIQGMNEWKEETGFTPTVTVTDVEVVDTTLYIARGPDAANVTHARTNPTTGAWEFGTQSSVRCDLIASLTDANGQQQVYLANKGTSSVWKCPAAASWGAALVATLINGAKPVGNLRSRITNMIAYGDPQRVWIFKEDEFGSINTDIYARVPLDEYRSVRSADNGRAAFQHGVYLYFSLLNGLERYYEQRLDDVGPNRDAGLPLGRSGAITSLVGYPGRFFAAVDGGARNFSSVLCQNGTGWHEVYRSQLPSSRITSMLVQPIPGSNNVDRLWIADGSSIYWIPISINPKKDPAYVYEADGWLETGWISGSMKDITKYWNSVKVFAEGLSGQATVKVEYATDSDTDDYGRGEIDWLNAGTINSGPMAELQLGNYDVSGKRLKLRISLHSEREDITPRVKMLLIEAVTRVPVKRTWNVTFYVDDVGFDLNSDPISLTAQQALGKLRAWADSREQAIPLLMRHNHSLFDNLRVFIEPASVAPVGLVYTPDRAARLVGTMTLIEA